MASIKSPTRVELKGRDLEITLAALKCSETDIKIDFEKLAITAGFKNANTARTQWSTIKKKYGIITANHSKGASSANSPTPTKSTSSKSEPKRKRGLGGIEAQSPLKKKKPTEFDDDHDDKDDQEIKWEESLESQAEADVDFEDYGIA